MSSPTALEHIEHGLPQETPEILLAMSLSTPLPESPTSAASSASASASTPALTIGTPQHPEPVSMDIAGPTPGFLASTMAFVESVYNAFLTAQDGEMVEGLTETLVMAKDAVREAFFRSQKLMYVHSLPNGNAA